MDCQQGYRLDYSGTKTTSTELKMQKKNNEIIPIRGIRDSMSSISPASLILIRGVPGSTKTTTAEEKYPDHVLCEADQFFTNNNGDYSFDPKKIQDAHKWCQAKAKRSLQAGKNVVVANTFIRIWEMEPYFLMAKRLGCKVTVIEAKGNFKNVHGVPEEKVQLMRERFEPFQVSNYSSV